MLLCLAANLLVIRTEVFFLLRGYMAGENNLSFELYAKASNVVCSLLPSRVKSLTNVCPVTIYLE